MTAEKRYSKYFISPFSVKISAIIPRLEAETQSVRGKKISNQNRFLRCLGETSF